MASASAVPNTMEAISVPPALALPRYWAATAVNPRPAVISLENQDTYPMERYIPPRDARNPHMSSAVTWVLMMFMPTLSAAFGFSPTARIRIPSLVLFMKNHTRATDRNAR